MEAEERDWNQQKMTGMAKEKTSKKKYTVQRKVVRNTVDFFKDHIRFSLYYRATYISNLFNNKMGK